MRLDKLLALSGYGTRSEVKRLIRAGCAAVNGIVAKAPETAVEPETDAVTVEGKPIFYEPFSYYMLHKPSGVVTARSDKDAVVVMALFPEALRKKLSPVGRLDKDTEGLLLVTDDGALSHRLLSPAYHVPKTYEAVLDRPLPEDAVLRFAEGLSIGDEKPTLPAALTVLSDTTARLTIAEGRFHQVKRMFHAVGCEVTYLKRTAFGGLSLGELPRGEFRRLTEEEIACLREQASRKQT